jgi:hypothetical protein
MILEILNNISENIFLTESSNEVRMLKYLKRKTTPPIIKYFYLQRRQHKVDRAIIGLGSY